MNKDDASYAELIPAYLSKLLAEATEYRPRVEAVCGYCGAKHDGPFQACSRCKTLLDAGQG